MELSNLTGTDMVFILAIIAAVVAITFLAVLFFIERKNITEVLSANKDGSVYPKVFIRGGNLIKGENQIMRHPLGDVFFSEKEENINSDKTSAVTVQIIEGESSGRPEGGAAYSTLKITNKTEGEITVEGGRPIPHFSGEEYFPKETFMGSVSQIFIGPNKTGKTELLFYGADIEKIKDQGFQFELRIDGATPVSNKPNSN